MSLLPNNKPIFIDTWGGLALSHRQDDFHERVKEIYLELRRQKTEIYTSDYVLDELISLLFKRENLEYSIAFLEGILLSHKQKILYIENVTFSRAQYLGHKGIES